MIGASVSAATGIVERRVRVEERGEADEAMGGPPIGKAAAAARATGNVDVNREDEGFRTVQNVSGLPLERLRVGPLLCGGNRRRRDPQTVHSFGFRRVPEAAVDGNDTYEQDYDAFENKTGRVYEIQPPEGVTQEEFKDRIVEAAEGYDVPYHIFVRNSNAAAGYVIMEAGGKLPNTAGGVMGPGLRTYDPTPKWNPPPHLQ